MARQEMPLWKSQWTFQWTCSLAVWVPTLIERVSRSVSEYGEVLGARLRTENWRTDAPVDELRGAVTHRVECSHMHSSSWRMLPNQSARANMSRERCTLAPSWQFTAHTAS